MENNQNDDNMKKLLFALSLVSSAAMAQNYEPMWKEYDKYDRDNRPASAIEVLDKIYDTALEHKDFATMLKSYILKTNKQTDIDGDSSVKDRIASLEAMADMNLNTTDRVILSSLLFSYYSNYYDNNWYRLSNMTPVDSDKIPEDIDEWSLENLFDRMLHHLSFIEENTAILATSVTGDYDQLFEKNSLGDYVGHTIGAVVLELVSNEIQGFVRSIENAYEQTSAYSEIKPGDKFLSANVEPAGKYDFVARLSNLYRKMEKEYLDRNMTDAFIIVDIDRIEAFRNMNFHTSQYRYSGDDSEGILEIDSVTLSAYGYLENKYGKRKKVIPYIHYMKAQIMKDIIPYREETLALIRSSVRKYSSSLWCNAMKELEQDITMPYIYTRAEVPCYGMPLEIMVESRNLKSCRVRVYKAKPDKEYVLMRGDNYDKFLSENAELYSTQEFKLTHKNDWETSKDTLTLDALPQGKWYMLIDSRDGKVSSEGLLSMDITRYAFVTSIIDGKRELLILDNRNGKPQSGVNVEVCASVNSKPDTVMVTDSRGVVAMPEGYSTAFVYSGNEYKAKFDYIRFNEIYQRDVNQYTYKLYTDRAVYRPGQKVCVSGLVARAESEGVYSAASGQDVDIRLTGSYGLNLELSAKRTSDEFGTFAAEFVLPQHCANGQYYITAGSSRINIRIEEYKRPTFEVSLEKPADNYSLGDTVTVKGNATLLAGAAVPDAEVRYKIERGTSSWSYWWFSNYAIIGEGNVKTGSDGNFSIPVSLEPIRDNGFDGFYSYRITAYVTSLSGETREEQVMLYAGEKSRLMKGYADDVVMRDNGLDFTVKVTNLANAPVDAEGTYSLVDAVSGKEILNGTFKSNIKTAIPSDRLVSGKFILKFEIDDNGKKIKDEKEVVLFSENDTKTPVSSHMWCHQLSREVSADRPAEFMLGTSSDEAYVIMFVTDGEKTIERRDIVLHNEMQRISVPMYNASDKGIGIHLVSCKDGNIYDTAFTYDAVVPEHKLTMKWEVFRDNLRPGQEEEWRMTLTNPDGTPAKANVMACMYDSALDMIYNRPVDFLLDYSRIVYLTPLHWSYRGRFGASVSFTAAEYPYELPEHDSFRDFILGSMYGGKLFYCVEEPRRMYSKSANAADNIYVEDNSVLAESAVVAAAPSFGDGQEQEPVVRENFAETAFFYPQLRTNDKGEVSISFTLPESMTRWHFQALAHTGNMYQMQADTMVVASKELMVMPQLPRFVRSGDKVSVAASVVNCTEKELAGNVRFEIFDPETGKVLVSGKQDFAAEGNGTAKVAFSFDADDRYQTLGVRMVADSPTFSDGEQRVIPVLSDKVHVTESVHFSVNGGKTKEYDLSGLFNSNDKKAENKKLTVEAVSSPVWLAIEALPVMGSDVDTDNAVSNMIALYANSVARHLLVSDSKIETLARAWTEAVAHSDSPVSALDRNPELKNILLAETPWLLDAKDDNDRIRRLATLFDRNNINYLEKQYAGKIAALQSEDGSISWFKGGKGSYYITSFVAEKMLSLQSMGVQLSEEAQKILERAVEYINSSVAERYQRMLKDGVLNASSAMTFLDFAYMKAAYGMQLTADSKFAYDYAVSALPENLKSMSPVSIARAVVVLKDAGNLKEAERFFTSLGEYAVGNEEEGLSFPSQTGYYGWGEYPVTAHVAMMKAYRAMEAPAEKIDALRLWLLQQKRTQDWGNPVATVDAVSELLGSGTDWVADGGQLNVRIGKTAMEFGPAKNKGLNAAGRQTKVFEGKDIPSRIKTLTVSRDGEAPSWGAVYAQFDIPYSELEENGSGMKISKQTFIRRIVDGREVLLDPSKVEAAVGDEYVSQIRFSLDRDMDFVHIRDRRAACAEPGISLSGYRMCGQVWTYVQERDSSTDYFFDSIAKGEYILQAVYRIDRAGEYTTGNAEIQCLYAPEFNAHSASETINVVK